MLNDIKFFVKESDKINRAKKLAEDEQIVKRIWKKITLFGMTTRRKYQIDWDGLIAQQNIRNLLMK